MDPYREAYFRGPEPIRYGCPRMLACPRALAACR
jgi:hypothetical protein